MLKEYIEYIIVSRSGKYIYSSYEDDIVALVSISDIQYCHILKSEEEAKATLEILSKAQAFFCEDKIHKFANLKISKLITKITIEDL